jgi:hypothetical protein
MNEAQSQKQAGFGSAGQGIDQGLGMLNDLQGTNAYMELLNKLYGQNAGVTNPNVKPMPVNYKQQIDPLANFRGLIKPRN